MRRSTAAVKIHARWFVLVMIFGLIASGLAWYPLPPDTPEQQVMQAWQLAQTSGTYRYATNIEQTTHKPPSLASTGGSNIQTDQMRLEGSVDQSQQQLHLLLWPNGSGRPEEALEIAVDGQKAKGRQGNGPWQEIEDPTNIFAPGGDPLGFLAGIEQVSFEGAETRTLGAVSLDFQRYSFKLDGAAFSTHMQAKLNQQLQAQGALPMGMEVDVSESYRQMLGSGELWLDPNGLPVRLELYISLPPQANGNRVQATITSDFMDFDEQRLALASSSFWEAPLQWAEYRFSVALPALRTFGQASFVWILEILVLILAIRYWRRKRVQTALAASMIIMLVTTPLLQARNVAAFTTTQEIQQTEQTTQQTQIEQREQAIDQVRNSWNPQQDPMTKAAPASEQLTLPGVLAGPHPSTRQAVTTSSVDSDGDGLSDVDEADWNTCASSCNGVVDPTDTDGDGLSDGAEVNQIGTIPSIADSDNDSIDDGLEVQGFSSSGTMWYFDPLNNDSNYDGLMDGSECAVWSNANADFSSSAVCPDTDGDGRPDAFDNDNDNDGVQDDVDLSSELFTETIYSNDNPLNLQITNLQTDYPVFVDFQLRPSDPEHLMYQSRILDWPSNDADGQIQRVLDTTFATSTNSEIVSSDANAAYGDIKLIPMLEITMPYADGHYANLPVTTTYSGVDRTQGIAVDEWIDTTELDPYGITVRDLDESSGDLVAYLPVTIVYNSDGGNAAAFGARMLYYPEQGSNGIAEWGNDQQVRLIWMVQMITDACIDETADPDTCAREESLSVVHVYDEEWTLAGLSVTEDHGIDAAILYEDPTQDDDLSLDDDLWMVAWNMTKTFLRGRDCDVLNGTTCQSNGERDVRIDNLASSINTWSSGNSAVQVANFPSYLHEGYLADIAMTQTPELLNTIFSPYAAQTNPTFLVAQEKTSRSVNIGDATSSLGSVASLNLDPASVQATMTVGISWSPYQYIDGTWTNYDLEEYLVQLDSILSTNDDFLADVLGDDEEVSGKLVWAQIFYTAINQGMLGIAEIGGTPAWTESTGIFTETDYQTDWYTEVGTADGMVGIAEEYQDDLSQIFENVKKSYKTLGKWKKFSKAVTGITFSPEITKQLKLLKTATKYAVAATIAITVIGTSLMIAGFLTGNDTLVKAGAVIMTAAAIIIVTMRTVMIVSQMASVIKTVSGVVKTLNALQSVAKANRSLAIVSNIVSLSAVWGVFIYQLSSGAFETGSNEFNMALASAIAQTIVILIFLVLEFIPLIGPLIVALIALIDLILALFDVQGFSGWLTEFIADQLYDVDYVISNLMSSERLEFAIKSVGLVDNDLGYITGNSLTISMGITNSIQYHSYSNVGEARQSTFRYTLQQAKTDQHASLERNDMYDEWAAIGNRTLQYSTNITVTEPISFNQVGAGVNQTLDGYAYLTEAYVEPYEGCWLAFGFEADCTWYENKGSNHINIGQYQLFDILPEDISTFVNLDWNSNRDIPFPAQKDQDGDGLLSTNDGGADPDDTLYDTDGDTLSDAYELSIGTSPTNIDTDADRISDAEELAYGSDPLNADSDGDGLTDYIEVKQGWLVSYTDLQGQTQLTKVWSDPHTIDADDDSLSDLEEYTFGFNPWVETDPSLIDNLIQLDELQVAEQDTAVLLARFDESGGAESFVDSSSNNFTLTCVSTACPTSGATGRYGNGLSLDGTEYVQSDNGIVELAQGSFTLAAWIKTTNTSQAIMTKSDGDNTWESGEKSFYINSVGRPTFVGFGNEFIYSTSAINDGTWHHVAVTWDYTSGTSGSGKMYVDGVDITSSSTSYAPNNVDNSADVLAIGRSNRNASEAPNNFTGELDEIVVYDRALATSEIGLLRDGRYNTNDQLLLPGSELAYQATITNTLITQAANGHLSASNQTVNPQVVTPKLALPLNDLDRKHTFYNSSGASSTATCIGSSCPTTEIVANTDLAVRFDGVDDYIDLPLQIQTVDANEREFSFSIKVESLPAAGEIASVYASNHTEDGGLNIYLNSAGNLIFDVTGAVPNSYYNGVTYDSTWTGPHISVFSFATSLDTWVAIRWTTSTFSTRIYLNGNTGSAYDSQLGYASLPQIEIGNGRFGATTNGTPSFHGSLNNITAEDRYNVKILNLAFDEDYSYAGSQYYNGAGTGTVVACTDNLASTCPAYNLTGASNQSITFDGIDDYVPLSDGGSFGNSSEQYITFWLNVASLPSSGNTAYILDTPCSVSEDCLDIYLDSDGHIVSFISSWFSGRLSNFTFNASNLNTWVKVQLRIRVGWTSSDNTTLSVYINDVYDSNYAMSNVDSLKVAPGRLGNNLEGTAPYHGGFDELSLGSVYGLTFDAPVFDFEEINRVNNARAAACSYFVTCPTFTTQGRYNGALSFDGTNDYMIVDPIDFAVSDYTVGMWFKSSAPTQQALLSASDPNNPDHHGVYLELQTDGRLRWLHRFPTGTGGGTNIYTSAAYNDDVWHYLTAVKSDNAMTLYVDGSAVGTQTATTSSTLPLDITLGRLSPTKAERYFNGLLDEITVIPAAVDNAGVAYLMGSTYPALDISDDFVSFSVPAQSEVEVSGSAVVNQDIVSSQQRFQHEAEAAIEFQTDIDYPVTDDNAANLPLFLPFEDVPGSTVFKNIGDVSYWTNIGRDMTTAYCSPPDCPSAGLRGQIDRAAYFDGQGDSLYINTCCALLATSLSMSAWVNGDSGTIIDTRSNNQEDGVQLDFNRLIVVADSNGTTSGGLVSYETPIDIPENTWTHVVAVLDATTDMAYVYLNGALASSLSIPALTSDSGRVSNYWPTIGRNQGDGNDFYRGYLDDVRLWTTTLNASAIQTLYTESAAQFQLQFDEEGESTFFTDTSPNGYTGIPKTTQCGTLSFTNLTATSLASAPSNLAVRLDTDRLLYVADLTAGSTAALTGSSVLCAGESLTLERINNDSSTTVIQSQLIDVTAVGAGSTTFQSGSDQLSLAWTIAATPLYEYNPAPGNDGKIGNTALFDGNGYIEFADADAVNNLTSQFTVIGWINPESPSSSTTVQQILAAGLDQSTNGFGFGLYGSKLRFSSYGLGDYNSNATIVSDVWQQVAVVFDGSYDAKFYIDGVYIDTIPGANPTMINSDDPLYVGGSVNASGALQYLFNGQIDELSVYSRELTTAEIYSMYLRDLRWYRARQTTYLTVDADAPIVSLLSDYPYRSNEAFQLAVAATDATSRVTLVDVGVQGPNDSEMLWSGAPVCAEATTSGAAWCPSIDSAEHGGEGIYTVQLRAVDAVGNQTISDDYSFYVDATAPAATFTNASAWRRVVTVDGAQLSWTVALSGTITDLDLANGIAGSGVDPDSVQISVVDVRGKTSGTGSAQVATVSGSSWSIDYQFVGQRPSGRYTVQIIAQDLVGNSLNQTFARNSQSAASTIILDARPPSLDMDTTIWSGLLISETAQLSGTLSEVPSWGGAVANYHLEDVGSSFRDSSGTGNAATCIICPATTPGLFGSALSFDATLGTRLTVAHTETLELTEATFSAWINPTWESGANRYNPPIWALTDGNTARYSWQISDDYQAMLLDNGTSVLSVPMTLNRNTWQHVALVSDGTSWTGYVDGVATGTVSQTLGSATGMPLVIGATWIGDLDELSIYDRALSANEIYALAQDEVSGVSSVEIWLESVDFNGGTSAESWQTVNLDQAGSLATWSYDPSQGLEGFYQLHARGRDAFDNVGSTRTAWRGSIDTFAPRVSVAASFSGGGSVAQTHYTVEINDLFVDETSITTPCAEPVVTKGYYSNPQRLNHLTLTCTIEGHAQGVVSATACDYAGHCTTFEYTLPSATLESGVNITAPTETVITGTNPISITGAAFATAEISAVLVYVDDTLIDSFTYAPAVTDTLWATTWTPADFGSYTLMVVLQDQLQQTYTDTLEVQIVNPVAPGGVFNQLDLWVKADAGIEASSDGSVVTTWQDQASGWMAVNSVDVPPSLNLEGLNFNPTVTFGITSPSELNFGENYVQASPGSSGMTIFAVAVPSSSGSRNFLLDAGFYAPAGYGLALDTTNAFAYVPSTDTGDGQGHSVTAAHDNAANPAVLSYEMTFGIGSSLSLNGSTLGTAVNTQTTRIDSANILYRAVHEEGAGPLTIGRQAKNASSGSRYFQGDLAEVIIYASVLSPAQQRQVESYLAIKYGTTLMSGTLPLSYTSSVGTVVWDAEALALYHHNLAGIGRDDLAQLDQRQSHSTSSGDVLTVAHASDFSTDQQFLLWGHDAGSLTNVLTGTSGATSYTRFERVWRFSETGTITDVQLTFDLAGVLTPTQALLAVSEHSDFSSSELVVGQLLGNQLIFTTDLPDGAYVALVAAADESLSVALNGTATGTVTSTPSGLVCGITCTATFEYGTVVTLTATPDLGASFTGWSGACSGTEPCVVTLDQAHSVTATFDVATYTLTVSLAGNGTGTVTSTPNGIVCDITCTATFEYGTVVTLTATPEANSTFTGWSGACSGTEACVVTLDQVTSVTATFDIGINALTVSLAGVGSGSVTSTPSGIECGITCTATFEYGTVVTLTATPDVGASFAGWSGACSGTEACVVTLDQARSVTAMFEPHYAVYIPLLRRHRQPPPPPSPPQPRSR